MVVNDPVNETDPSGLLGLGVDLNASVERGVIAAGFGATGSVGGGVFLNGSSSYIGGFASGGTFAGGPGWGMSAPPCPNKNNWALV